MTWDIHSIKATFEAAEEIGASHVIISHTNVDFDQTSTLVMPGEDPRKVWEESDAKHNGYGAVDEVYRISLGWESQSKEHRAMHWEAEEAVLPSTPEPQPEGLDQEKLARILGIDAGVFTSNRNWAEKSDSSAGKYYRDMAKRIIDAYEGRRL